MATLDLPVGSMGWTSHGSEGNLVQHGYHGSVREDRHVLGLTVRAVYPPTAYNRIQFATSISGSIA